MRKEALDKYRFVPQAVRDMTPVVKTSKLGNRYTMWTEAWFINLVRGQLREAFHRWPVRLSVLERVKVVEETITRSGRPSKRPTVWYVCEQCGAKCKATVAKGNPKNYVRIWVDHIDPVVPVDKVIGFDEYINRLFCKPENLQALCDTCHKAKSAKEKTKRTNKKSVDWRR